MGFKVINCWLKTRQVFKDFSKIIRLQMSFEPQHFDKMSKGVISYISMPWPLTPAPQASAQLTAFPAGILPDFFYPGFMTLRSL